MYIDLHLFFSDFNVTSTFLPGFRKILKYQSSWKSSWSRVVARDGQTEMTQLTVAFRNIVNVPNNVAAESCRATENTCLNLNNFIYENCDVYGIICNNMVERSRPQERCDLHAG
jgi:hypothetical protein